MENKIYTKIISLMKKANKQNEIAVAAVIVKNNKIISSAYNKRKKTNDVTAHAEIIAIRKAERKLKDWRLDGCDMYVSLKPCSMCEAVIKESRINSCYYLSNRLPFKKEYNKTMVSYKQTTYEEMLIKILQKSFKKMRKNS
jgi:tRNA(adenine34) deaminase